MNNFLKTKAPFAGLLMLSMFLVGCQNVTTSATSTYSPAVKQTQNSLAETNKSAWEERATAFRERQRAYIEKSRERRKIAAEKRKVELQERREARQKRIASLTRNKTKNTVSNQKKINRAFAKAKDDKNNSLRVGWIRVDGKFVYQSKKDILEKQEAAKKKAAQAAKAKQRRKASPKGSYNKLIAKYAAQHGVPYRLARAVVFVESSFRANVTGAAGEIGLMQIRLSTARGMGYKGTARQLYNPSTNLYWGMKYLGRAHQLAGGSTCGTILKYNAGHGAKRMNPISRRYCNRVSRII